jgi:hypothetical protein
MPTASKLRGRPRFLRKRGKRGKRWRPSPEHTRTPKQPRCRSATSRDCAQAGGRGCDPGRTAGAAFAQLVLDVLPCVAAPLAGVGGDGAHRCLRHLADLLLDLEQTQQPRLCRRCVLEVPHGLDRVAQVPVVGAEVRVVAAPRRIVWQRSVWEIGPDLDLPAENAARPSTPTTPDGNLPAGGAARTAPRGPCRGWEDARPARQKAVLTGETSGATSCPPCPPALGLMST